MKERKGRKQGNEHKNKPEMISNNGTRLSGVLREQTSNNKRTSAKTTNRTTKQACKHQGNRQTRINLFTTNQTSAKPTNIILKQTYNYQGNRQTSINDLCSQ